MDLDLEINPIEFGEDGSFKENILKFNIWKNP